MPAVEQGNLAALEGDDVRAAPRQRWRVALAVAVLLAIAALVWVMASGS